MPGRTINMQTLVTALTHDARGIATIDGKTVFIEGALPDEIVEFAYIKKRGKFDEAKVTKIIRPSPERVEPRCQHFGVCGGCALQHLSTQGQITLKQKLLLDQLAHFGKVQPEIILKPLTASAWAYRRKARLGVKYVVKKNAVLVGFREKNGRYLADLKRCEILHSPVGSLITPVQQLISQLTAYEHIAQIEVAIGDNATVLIFRNMIELSTEDQNKIVDFAQQHQLVVYLQPNKPDSIYCIWPNNNSPTLFYQLDEHEITLDFLPNDFTQVNADINQQMIKQALELLEPDENDRILDLFCGLGNFTLPLARTANYVVGVEGDHGLIQRAQANANKNNIKNVAFYQADLTADISLMPWTQEGFNKILLDPPRTGALEIMPKLAQFNANKIIYVSCNPATLARDAGELTRLGYTLKTVGIMDMFPHTHHVEAMCLFVKN